MHNQAVLAHLRKGQFATAFEALLGITLMAFDEDFWLLDREDTELPGVRI